MQFLHDVDHAVWVWQGGRRQFSSTELQELLFKARLDDPIAQCTAHLLMNLGDQAAKTRRYEREAVRCNPRLSRALRELETFVQMRDKNYRLPPAEIGRRLRMAAHALSHAAEIRKTDSVFPPPEGSRNPALAEQEKRNAGGYFELQPRTG